MSFPEIECKDTMRGKVISQCFPIMHNKSHSFPLAFVGDPDREVEHEGDMIVERALVYINREGFTDKTYCLWWNHFGVWLDA